MKTLIKLFIAFLVITCSINIADAQISKKEKQAAKAAAVKNMIDNVRYIFEATYVNPQRGPGKQLTYEYDLKVLKDTITAYLPYFGRAYVAPTDPTEGGIKFTTTNFNYSSKQVKNGNWEIVIKPKTKNIGDMRDVQQLMLTVTSAGYASLNIISTNRDPISFNGYIEEVKPKK
jgi:hypothetical protein